MSLKNLAAWNTPAENVPATACGTACGANDAPHPAATACGTACGAKDRG